MLDLGKHAFFIWSSYAVFTVTLLGLVGWLIVDGYLLQQAQRELEEQGIRRRSEQ